jgi:hypothetical protein
MGRFCSGRSIVVDEIIRIGLPEACHLLQDAQAIFALRAEDAGDVAPLCSPVLASLRIRIGRQPLDERDRPLGIDDRGSGEERTYLARYGVAVD